MDREEEFLGQLALAARSSKSWRERLQWVRDRLTDPAFAGAVLPQLAAVAIYLRFLATGERRQQRRPGLGEDGREPARQLGTRRAHLGEDLAATGPQARVHLAHGIRAEEHAEHHVGCSIVGKVSDRNGS